MKLAYFSPMPPEKSGISDYSALLLPALRERIDVEVVRRGRKRGAARDGPGAVPRRERPERACVDRRRAAQAAGRRRPPRLRPPPPRRRDDARPRRSRRLPRPDGARARRRGPSSRVRRDGQADPRALGVARRRLPARDLRARPRDRADRPLASTCAIALARPATRGTIDVVPHPAWPAPAIDPERVAGGTVVACFGVVNASKRIPELLPRDRGRPSGTSRRHAAPRRPDRARLRPRPPPPAPRPDRRRARRARPGSTSRGCGR